MLTEWTEYSGETAPSGGRNIFISSLSKAPKDVFGQQGKGREESQLLLIIGISGLDKTVYIGGFLLWSLRKKKKHSP